MQNAEENFITLFTGNETSDTWFNAAIAMNKPWSEKLHDVSEEAVSYTHLPLCSREKRMLGLMVGALVLWIFGGDYIDAAMVGYSVVCLLYTSRCV